MKKILSTLAVLLTVCLLLCSCGKKTKCSGQAVSVGKSAIEAADDYLDNNQSAHDALDRLDELKEKMEDLYKILLSAEMLAQDSSTTILETYSIYTVDDIRTRLKKLDSLLELNSDFNYTITTDENDISQRKRVDLMGLLMIHENLNYFSRLYKN